MIIKGNEVDVRKHILDWFKKNPGRTAMEVSTCPTDSYGWSLEGHYAMDALGRQGLPGFSINRHYKFGVYDWHIVRDSPPTEDNP